MKTDTEFTVFTKIEKNVFHLAMLLCHFFRLDSGSQPHFSYVRIRVILIVFDSTFTFPE